MSEDPPISDYVPPKVPEERPGSPGGKRHRNRMERTRLLCEAGLTVFLERGVDGATIDDVVKVAGVSKGSFYRYFDGKEALISTIFGPLSDMTAAAFDTATDALEAATTDPELEAAYGLLVQGLVGVLTEHEDAVRLFLQERHGPDSSSRAPILELDGLVVERAIAMTHSGRHTKLLRDFDPRVSALAVIGAVMEMMRQTFRGHGPDDPVSGALELVDLVLHGVRAPADAG